MTVLKQPIMTTIINYLETDEDTPAPTGALINRVPFYFGADIDPLFGWCHLPQQGSQSRLGVVICPPLGHEYVHAHRSLRHLADHFAAVGIPAMRFDYQGAGDSGGVDEDPDRLTAWLNSIRSAMSLLRTDYGCEQVGLVGLRMGGTLAAIVASEADLACLVMWAPCVRGRHYVREMKALQLTGEANSNDISASGGDMESAGYILTEQTIKDLGNLNLEKVLPRTTRILLVARDDLADDLSLRKAWSAQDIQTEYRRMPGYIDMLAAPHNTKVPIMAIRNIVTWVNEGPTSQKNHGRAMVRPERLLNEAIIRPRSYAEDSNIQADTNVRERIFQFDTKQKLFGVFCEPANGGSADRPAILLLNSGAVHHVGASRLYVLLARNLAQAGFCSLRMDFPGLGDSVIDAMDKENDSYTADSTTGILSAIHALKRAYHTKSFVVMGVCSGAHSAFHAGLDLPEEPITECLLINPLTFYWKEGMSLEVTQAEHFSNWNQYMEAMHQWSRWKKLLCGGVDIGAIIAAVNEKARVKLSNISKTLKRAFTKGDQPTRSSEDLEADISQLLGSGRRLAFIFSDTDPGYDLLMAHAGRAVKKLVKEGEVTIEFIANANHTFTSRPARREVISRITRHIAKRYSTRESRAQQ
jgi:alpha-beta hydrolase superfamily lysophospholipase